MTSDQINLGETSLFRSAVTSDFQQLLQAYSIVSSIGSITQFAQLWGERGFSEIHRFPVTDKFRHEYVFGLYGVIFELLNEAALNTAVVNTGICYSLYFVFYSQPQDKEKFYLPVTPSELLMLINFVKSARLVYPDVGIAIDRMIYEDVFVIVPESCNPNSFDADYLECNEVKKAYMGRPEKLAVLENIISTDLEMNNFLYIRPMIDKYKDYKNRIGVEKIRETLFDIRQLSCEVKPVTISSQSLEVLANQNFEQEFNDLKRNEKSVFEMKRRIRLMKTAEYSDRINNDLSPDDSEERSNRTPSYHMTTVGTFGTAARRARSIRAKTRKLSGK